MPIAKFEMPDGRIAKFEVPEGTTAEQAQQLISEQIGNISTPQTQQEQPEQQTQPEKSGLRRFGELAGRAALEGLADIPGSVYTTGATLAHLPQIAQGQEVPESAKWNTKQYGEQYANQLGLEKPTPENEIPMHMAESAISFGAGGGLGRLGANVLPKVVASIAGAHAPITTAIGAGVSTGAGDVARELTKEDESAWVRVGVPLIAGILGGSAVSAMGKAGKMIVSPSERGSEAFIRQQKELEKQGITQEDLEGMRNLTPTAAQYTENVKPTASMAYTNPAIADAELMARLRNRSPFYNRDIENTKAVAQALRQQGVGDADFMLKELNARTTPLRESAIAKAESTGGYELPVKQAIDELLTSPGTRYESSVKTLTNPIASILESENMHPLDLYARRKALADALNNKAPMTMDEMTNAAKNQRREATILKKAIDKGLNQSSNGEWENYIATHREGMKPISELEAWQQTNAKFDTAPEIEMGVPSITPNRLRTAIDKETYSKSGRDLLSAGGREEADKMIQTMNAIERAKSMRGSLSGSQTMPLLVESLKKTTPSWAQNALGGVKDFLTGNADLDEAILNPEKLPALIELAIKNKDERVINALRNAAIRSTEQNIVNTGEQ